MLESTVFVSFEGFTTVRQELIAGSVADLASHDVLKLVTCL